METFHACKYFMGIYIGSDSFEILQYHTNTDKKETQRQETPAHAHIKVHTKHPPACDAAEKTQLSSVTLWRMAFLLGCHWFVMFQQPGGITFICPGTKQGRKYGGVRRVWCTVKWGRSRLPAPSSHFVFVCFFYPPSLKLDQEINESVSHPLMRQKDEKEQRRETEEWVIQVQDGALMIDGM